MERLYEQSLLVLAALEDKTHRGASIAAPNMPWIWGTLSLADDKETSDPYHLVWPRDFYHAATAQKAAGDDAAANRLVDYLWRSRSPRATSGRTPGSTARRSGRASSSTRRPCRSCSRGGWAAPHPRTGTTSGPLPTT